jgi:hypothetical protein
MRNVNYEWLEKVGAEISKQDGIKPFRIRVVINNVVHTGIGDSHADAFDSLKSSLDDRFESIVNEHNLLSEALHDA